MAKQCNPVAITVDQKDTLSHLILILSDTMTILCFSHSGGKYSNKALPKNVQLKHFINNLKHSYVK